MAIAEEKIEVIRDGEDIQVIIDGETRPVERVIKAFPHSNPDRFVGLMDPDGREIMLIESLDSLEEPSRELLKELLKDKYFVPTILEILSLESRGTGSSWTVMTDDGERSFDLPSRDRLDGSNPPSIIIQDENQRRYFIDDFWDLDKLSREKMTELVPDKLVKAKYMRAVSGRGMGKGSGRGSSRGSGSGSGGGMSSMTGMSGGGSGRGSGGGHSSGSMMGFK